MNTIMTTRNYAIAMFVSFLVAGVFLSGVVMANDFKGRIIIGSLWGVVGVGWLLRLLQARASQRGRK